MRSVKLLIFLTLCSCGNHELRDMGKFQDSQDLTRLKIQQEDRDEKIRKDRKYEHRDDIMFNLEVQRQQLSLDEKKLSLISRYGSNQEPMRSFNGTLDDERDRMENIDGQPSPNREPSNLNSTEQPVEPLDQPPVQPTVPNNTIPLNTQPNYPI